MLPSARPRRCELPCRREETARSWGKHTPGRQGSGQPGQEPLAPNTGIDNKPIGSPSLLLKPPFHLTAPPPPSPSLSISTGRATGERSARSEGQPSNHHDISAV